MEKTAKEKARKRTGQARSWRKNLKSNKFCYSGKTIIERLNNLCSQGIKYLTSLTREKFTQEFLREAKNKIRSRISELNK